MKISTKGRYALRMMLDIAAHQGDGYVTLRDIAERQAVSKKYLEQIALQLTQAGMLRAMRGQLGGYRLAKRRADPRVWRVLAGRAGARAPVTGLALSPTACERCGDCPTLPVWQGLHDVICTYLSGITLETLLRQSENSGVER